MSQFDNNKCCTPFSDCSMSADQLTESMKSFSSLYQSLIDQNQGRCCCCASHLLITSPRRGGCRVLPWVCLSVCLSVSMFAYLKNHPYKLNQILCTYYCGRGTVHYWWQWFMLYASGFVVILCFHIMGPLDHLKVIHI